MIFVFIRFTESFLNLGAWKETFSPALSVFPKHTYSETSHGILTGLLS